MPITDPYDALAADVEGLQQASAAVESRSELMVLASESWPRNPGPLGKHHAQARVAATATYK